MRRLAALALAFLAQGAVAQTDSPWLNWVAENSPHGFDITPDGTIWINVAEPGERDDYAIRAEDLQSARSLKSHKPEFWVRGYHKRNPTVKFRQSKMRLRIDCENETIERLTVSYYGPDNSFLGSDGYRNEGYIVPGTYGEEYHRLLCIVD